MLTVYRNSCASACSKLCFFITNSPACSCLGILVLPPAGVDSFPMCTFHTCVRPDCFRASKDMRRNPFRKRTANPSQETQLDTSFVAFQPVLLDNPLYRTTADREQVVPTSPAQPEQVMDQRHDEKADPDYDFVADEGARSSAPSNAAYTPSFNPVYGQPPTGTPLRQVRYQELLDSLHMRLPRCHLENALPGNGW